MRLSNALVGEGDSKFAKTMTVFKERDYYGWFILENSYSIIPDAANWKGNIQIDTNRIKKVMIEA